MERQIRALTTIQEVRASLTGTPVEGNFLLLEKQPRRTKEGKLILNLKLGDKTGTVEGVIWDGDKAPETLAVGQVIKVLRGDVGQYNQKPQLIVRDYEITAAAPEDYLLQTEIDVEHMAAQFDALIASVRDRYMRLLLEAIFTPERKQQFKIIPGGRVIHHGYRGGLLEHSLSVAQLCEDIARRYPALNRDLLLTGALLHDVGKLEEYALNLTVEYTIPGKLLGHISMGEELVGRTIARLEEEITPFPQELVWMLKHLLLSHHGMLEYGSPVLPQFPEALALHMADNLDAKIHAFFQRMEADGGDHYFSAYDTLFRQQFFRFRYQNQV
jgi:3'-5' exoribonuclease